MIEQLYTAYYRELVIWCTTMTGDRSQAEDLVQEAFLRAMKHEGHLSVLEEKQRRSWLYRTVKNLFIDKIRHASFETVTSEVMEESRDSVFEYSYDFLESEQLLQALPDEEQILFVMRYLQGYNSTELSRIFNLPAGTIRARLSSARKHLKEALNEAYY